MGHKYEAGRPVGSGGWEVGRKKTMDDPDMGYWTYTYVAMSNLTVQTSARSSTTSSFVGNYYEKTGSTITNYYAGATRVAMRTGGTLSYLLGDHLGSISVVTDISGTSKEILCITFG